jgi:hypothetical protein
MKLKTQLSVAQIVVTITLVAALGVLGWTTGRVKNQFDLLSEQSFGIISALSDVKSAGQEIHIIAHTLSHFMASMQGQPNASASETVTIQSKEQQLEKATKEYRVAFGRYSDSVKRFWG